MSLKIKEIAFSCYAVTDMARARAFYEGVLGLHPDVIYDSPEGLRWVEYNIGPGTLALGSAPGWKPNPDGCSVALEVEDFDAAIAALRAAGIRFRQEPIETPGCHMAGVLDPDGNSVIFHRRKNPTA